MALKNKDLSKNNLPKRSTFLEKKKKNLELQYFRTCFGKALNFIIPTESINVSGILANARGIGRLLDTGHGKTLS